ARMQRLAGLRATVPSAEECCPGRDQYVAIGYAVKAAGAAEPDEAYSIFHEWAMRWEGATDEAVALDWAKMKPPFSVGWTFLASEAARCGLANEVAQAEFEAAEPA